MDDLASLQAELQQWRTFGLVVRGNYNTAIAMLQQNAGRAEVASHLEAGFAAAEQVLAEVPAGGRR